MLTLNRHVYDAVVTENYQGAYQAVSYLIEHGHRHIGIVGSLPRAYPSRFVSDGGLILMRCKSTALRLPTLPIVICAVKKLSPRPPSLLTQNPQITALFGVNDDMAIAAMRAAQTLGKHVPHDVSVIGFDDIDLAHLTVPALTTMQVDKINLGRTAVQTLINRVQAPDVAARYCGAAHSLDRTPIGARHSLRSLEHIMTKTICSGSTFTASAVGRSPGHEQ